MCLLNRKIQNHTGHRENRKLPRNSAGHLCPCLPLVRLSHIEWQTLQNFNFYALPFTPRYFDAIVYRFVWNSVNDTMVSQERRNTWYFVRNLCCAFILMQVMARCHQNDLNIFLPINVRIFGKELFEVQRQWQWQRPLVGRPWLAFVLVSLPL